MNNPSFMGLAINTKNPGWIRTVRETPPSEAGITPPLIKGEVLCRES